MTSLMLRTVARLVLYLLLVLSVYLLLRGHNDPGGGFIAGLLAAASLTLLLLAFDVATVERMIPVQFTTVTAVGLAIAGLAGVAPMLVGLPFLASRYDTVDLPLFGQVSLSSSLVFDLGVYLTVAGAVLTVIVRLAREGVEHSPEVDQAVEEDAELWRS